MNTSNMGVFVTLKHRLCSVLYNCNISIYLAICFSVHEGASQIANTECEYKRQGCAL